MLKWLFIFILFCVHIFIYKMVTIPFLLFYFLTYTIIFFPYKYYITDLQQLWKIAISMAVAFWAFLLCMTHMMQYKEVNTPIFITSHYNHIKPLKIQQNKTKLPHPLPLSQKHFTPIKHYVSFTQSFYKTILIFFTHKKIYIIFSYIISLVLLIYAFSSNYSMLISYGYAFFAFLLLSFLYNYINHYPLQVRYYFYLLMPGIIGIINYYKVKSS